MRQSAKAKEISDNKEKAGETCEQGHGKQDKEEDGGLCQNKDQQQVQKGEIKEEWDKNQDQDSVHNEISNQEVGEEKGEEEDVRQSKKAKEISDDNGNEEDK